MSGFAWVTLATNDSYSLGALVLAHSLRQSGTAHQLAILITPGVTNAMRKNLAEAFNVVEEVNIFDSKDEANLKLLRRPELGVTFTKLNCWRLTQFEKCVFLDADVLVLVNSDELFEREEFSAAPDVGWPDCFNSGVFVYKPSLETYNKLVEFALQRGSFDGGDQGLLNAYFSDWAHKDISKHLPFIYNMCSTASYSYMPAFKYYAATVKIVHFIGPAKPWLQYFDTESRQVHPSPDLQHLQDVLQKWWDIFCSIIHPKLSPEMSGLAGAFAQFTLGVKRSASQDALESHLRRQAWEVGNIDYMGRDSFDNIWSKICQTLSSVQLETGPNKAAAVSSSASQQVPEVAKDSQEISATIADTPVASEQPQETVAQAEVQADAPKLQEEVSPQPIETQELVTPPASSEVPQLEPEAILVSEVPSQPKLDTIPVSEVPLQPQSQATPVPEIPQPEPEAAPVITALPGVPQPEPEAAPVVTALPGVPQPEPEAAPVVTALPGVPQPEPEAAPVPTPLPEVPQPEPEVAPVPTPLPEVPQPEPEVAPVPEALKLQEESVPIQTQTVTVPEVPEPQPEPVPLQPEPTPVQEEVQAQSVAAPLQEIPESQPEVPVPVQETPQPQPESVPEVLQSHPEATQEIPQPTQEVPVAVSETAAVQPDVIPKTEEPSPKEEVKVDIPTTQKPAEAVQEAKGPELTQQLVTETPVPVEEPKVEQIEVKSEKAPIPQEVPKSEPKKPVKKVVQESIPPPAELKPVEKPVETPVLKEQSAPVKEEAAPVETKKTVQPHKIVQPSKKSTEKVGAPTKTESPAPAKAPKEPESPKVETSPSQESASGEASAEVPKSDTKPKETRKIKKKVKKVPKPESGDAPEGTSKK